MNRVGAVIIFSSEVTQEQAEKAIESLGKITTVGTTIRTFDDDWGTPVFYIP